MTFHNGVLWVLLIEDYVLIEIAASILLPPSAQVMLVLHWPRTAVWEWEPRRLGLGRVLGEVVLGAEDHGLAGRHVVAAHHGRVFWSVGPVEECGTSAERHALCQIPVVRQSYGIWQCIGQVEQLSIHDSRQ